MQKVGDDLRIIGRASKKEEEKKKKAQKPRGKVV